MKDINIRWKSYPHYLPKIRLRRRRPKSDPAAGISNTDGAGSSKVSKSGQALQPVADIPVDPDYSAVSIRELRLDNVAASLSQGPVTNREVSFSPRARSAERTYDPRIAPGSRTLVRSAKSTATQLGNFRPNVTTHRDGQIGKISVQKNRQSLRTISRYSSHSKARRSAAPSIQSVVRSVLSEAPSRSPSQRKALAQFTKDLARYAHKTKQLPNIPTQGLIESHSVTTVSANTIKELEPYRAQFVSAGLAVTSKEQRAAITYKELRVARRLPKPSIRQMDGRTDTKLEQARASQAKIYAAPATGGKRIKSVLKKKQPSFASGSTGTTVIGFTPPHEKSLPRGQQPRKASSIPSDHTVVGFTPPHEKFAARPSSPARSQVIVRTTHRQENYSPATISQDDTLTRSSPNSRNDQVIVTVQHSPGRDSPRPPSQSTYRSYVVPVTPNALLREETASPAYVDEYVHSQKMLQQERYQSPDVGSADTIVITRPHVKVVRQARDDGESSREPKYQTPLSQQRFVQRADYGPRSSPARDRRFEVEPKFPVEQTFQQEEDVIAPDNIGRALPIQSGFVQRPPILREEDAQVRYVRVETPVPDGGIYHTSPSQARQIDKQGGTRYYFDEEPIQPRYLEVPTRVVSRNYAVDNSQPRQVIVQRPGPMPDTRTSPPRQAFYQEIPVRRHVLPAEQDPFVEPEGARTRYVQESPTNFAGRYYYVKDPTAQQQLVLVPARTPVFEQANHPVLEQSSYRDDRPVIGSQPPPRQYITRITPMREAPSVPEQYIQQLSVPPTDYVTQNYANAQEILVQQPSDFPKDSPYPQDMYTRAQIFKSPPRSAIKKSLPWLRKALEPELPARNLQSEEVLVVSTRSDVAKPLVMSGPYPENHQVSTLSRQVRTKITFSGDFGMETQVSVDNIGTNTTVNTRQTPPQARKLVKIQKTRPQVQREVLVLEPNDQGGRLLNALERRGSRPSPKLKAPASVQTDRLHIERNRRVAPRDANAVDDLTKLVITQSPQSALTISSSQLIEYPSGTMWVADDTIESTQDESPSAMNSDTTKLLPSVQKRVMIRKVQVQDEQMQESMAVNVNDTEVEDVALDQDTSQVLPTIGKAVLVKKSPAQIGSMRGILVESSYEDDATPIQATEETLQLMPSERLPRAPGVWGPVDWTKRATVRDADEEEREIVAPSQVPSPQIPFVAGDFEDTAPLQDIPSQPTEMEVVRLENYDEAVPVVMERLPHVRETITQTTEVEIFTIADREQETEEVQILVSRSRSPLPPQREIAIPPRSPRRSQVRWLGNRNVNETPALPISYPVSPSPPQSDRLYAHGGTQPGVTLSPGFRDRSTSTRPPPEVKNRSTSIRPSDGAKIKHGLTRRKTHACTSGSFRCEQCHLSSGSPLPKLSSRRVYKVPEKTVEAQVEDVITPVSEAVNAVEDAEEVLVQRASAKDSIIELAKRTPIPDPAKRPSRPHIFSKSTSAIQTPALRSLSRSRRASHAAPAPSPAPPSASPAPPTAQPDTSSSPAKLQQPKFNTSPLPKPAISPTSSATDAAFAFDTRVFKGWHVATAAASDADTNAWIENQTGVSVRKFLVDLSVFDGVDAGVRGLRGIAERAREGGGS